MELRLSFQIKEQLRHYVESVNGEISLFGKVEISDEYIELIELKLFEQECSAASSTIENSDVAKFINEEVKKGNSLVGWNAWIHSHANMEVFWSGTDTGTMDENPLNTNFMLSLVTNKAEEYRARLDIYEPMHVFKDNLDVVIEYPEDESQLKRIKKEIKKLVTKPVPVVKGFRHWEDKTKTNQALLDYDKEIEKEAKNLASLYSEKELEMQISEGYADPTLNWDDLEAIEEALNIKIEQNVK